MTQTISLNENYGRKLKDEIQPNPVGLKGEVEVIVKNKDTGEVESQQKHNLIVYGAREWLLKKVFFTNTDEGDDFIKNSEVLWFGIGNGGGEPGNPLQCGCVYGSDKDLNSPVRMRYEFDTTGVSSNPYYASRIMPDGTIKSGYYKRITYVGIKEDQANPYKVNNKTFYPKLIAEVRLEISSEDCCGQTYLNSDFQKSYADINELALFIADRRFVDPGKQANNLTSYSRDYMYFNQDNSRTFREANSKIYKQSKKASNKYTFTLNENDTGFYRLCGVYYQDNVKPNRYDYSEEITIENVPTTRYYVYRDIKTNIFLREGEHEFNNIRLIKEDNFEETEVWLVSMETIGVVVPKHTFNDDVEQKDIVNSIYFKNGYTSSESLLYPEHVAFKNDSEYVNCVVSDDKKTITYYFLSGYEYSNKTVDQETGELKDCSIYLKQNTDFNKTSIITVQQSIDVRNIINIKSIYGESNSITRRFEVATEDDIKKIRTDGYSIEYNGKSYYIDYVNSENAPYYFTADAYDIPTGENLNKQCLVYKDSVTNPYVMFNKTNISTIRISQNRECLILWRVYF